MVTKPIRFIQIMANTDHIFGLTPEGDVYYRDKPPFSYNANHNVNYAGYGATVAEAKKKAEDDEKKVWKKLLMEYRYDIPKGGPEREAQSVNEPQLPAEEVDIEVDEPARKIYKDIDTVKRVQAALQTKGFYKETNKIDGDLGKYTTDGIKAFQKSINFKETGEIDYTLCNALELIQNQDNEVTIDLTDSSEVEEESMCGMCGSIGTHAHGCIEDTEAFIGA